MQNNRRIRLIAERNAIQWDLVKKVLLKTKEYKKATLLSYSVQKLAVINASLK